MESISEREPILDIETRGDLNSNNDLVQVNRKWQLFSAAINTIVHTLLGGSVFIILWFTWSLDFGPFKLHIILCVVGVSF